MSLSQAAFDALGSFRFVCAWDDTRRGRTGDRGFAYSGGLKAGRYGNGRLALVVEWRGCPNPPSVLGSTSFSDGDPTEEKLTVNLPEVRLADDEMIIRAELLTYVYQVGRAARDFEELQVEDWVAARKQTSFQPHLKYAPSELFMNGLLEVDWDRPVSSGYVAVYGFVARLGGDEGGPRILNTEWVAAHAAAYEERLEEALAKDAARRLSK